MLGRWEVVHRWCGGSNIVNAKLVHGGDGSGDGAAALGCWRPAPGAKPDRWACRRLHLAVHLATLTAAGGPLGWPARERDHACGECHCKSVSGGCMRAAQRQPRGRASGRVKRYCELQRGQRSAPDHLAGRSLVWQDSRMSGVWMSGVWTSTFRLADPTVHSTYGTTTSS